MIAPAEAPYTKSVGSRDSVMEDLIEVHVHHLEKSSRFQNICKNLYPASLAPNGIMDLPTIPVGIFKIMELKSTTADQPTTLLTSSGTSGSRSRIFVDTETGTLQAKALSATMSHWLGKHRRPMLIVDEASVLDKGYSLSARAAAIRSVYKFGKNHHFLLNSQGEINLDEFKNWLKENEDEEIFIFGFTFMVWKNIALKLAHKGISFKRAILFHGGGWKKMQNSAVSPFEFSRVLSSQFGIHEVRDYYGMVEQLGGIWVEGSGSIMLPSDYNHAIIRDPLTLEILPPGQIGLIHSFSTLPRSYPGHSILTEDLGELVPNDYFPEVYGNWGLRIHGRLPAAELRGCSDATV